MRYTKPSSVVLRETLNHHHDFLFPKVGSQLGITNLVSNFSLTEMKSFLLLSLTLTGKTY